MNIIKVLEANKTNYMDLLLIADESVDMIEKYLYRGDLFALYEEAILRSLCVVTKEETGEYELKNLVTVPEYEGNGYAKILIDYVATNFLESGKSLLVGTGECPWILRFYEKCGFTRSHVVPNFFIDNYDHIMYDDGIQLIDMIYLKREL